MQVEGSRAVSEVQHSALQAIGQVFSLEANAMDFGGDLGTSLVDHTASPGRGGKARGRGRSLAGTVLKCPSMSFIIKSGVRPANNTKNADKVNTVLFPQSAHPNVI